MSKFLPLYAHSVDGVMGIRRDGSCISWGQFYSDVEAISAHIEPSKTILACSDIYNFAVAFMALVHKGVDIILPPNLQSKTLEDINALEKAQLLDDACIESRLTTSCNQNVDEQPLSRSNKQSNITLYTSGSSGVPTAINKPLSTLEAEVAMFHNQWGACIKGGIFASSVAHYHAYGLPFCILWALRSGAPLALQQIGYPEELEYYAESNHINFIAAPAFFKRHDHFFKTEGKDFSHLQFVTSAGSPLPHDHAKNLANVLPNPVIEIYGSTETGAVATRSGGREDWQCLNGVTMDCDAREHICVSSPAIGNLGEIRTLQDRVEILKDGNFLLKGRSDRIIKIFEKRVSIDQLELRCCEHKLIKEAHIVALPSSERLGAVVTLTEDGISELEHVGKREFINTLRTYLLESFDLVIVPRKWRFVEEIPVNNMGKIHNQSLLAFFDDK